MTAPNEARETSTLPADLMRRFEAVVCDLGPDGAVDPVSQTRGSGPLIEAACAAGIDLALVADATPADLDRRLEARPAGPGRLLLAVHDVAAIFRVNRDGPSACSARPRPSRTPPHRSRWTGLTGPPDPPGKRRAVAQRHRERARCCVLHEERSRAAADARARADRPDREASPRRAAGRRHRFAVDDHDRGPHRGWSACTSRC